MAAKKQGKGTKVIFTPEGGSPWVGIFGPVVTETGRSSAPIDAGELDSEHVQVCGSEVTSLGSIEGMVYYDPENPFPNQAVRGVLRIEDRITNPANNEPAFRQGDAWVEEANTIRDVQDKMKTNFKFTFEGTNYTEDIEKTV